MSLMKKRSLYSYSDGARRKKLYAKRGESKTSMSVTQYAKMRAREDGVEEIRYDGSDTESSVIGTKLHARIKNWLKHGKTTYDSEEDFELLDIHFQGFLKFLKEVAMPEGWKFHSAEESVTGEINGIKLRGSYDAMFLKPNDDIVLIDWKYVKNGKVKEQSKPVFGRQLETYTILKKNRRINDLRVVALCNRNYDQFQIEFVSSDQ